jgi:hypothetical protein
MTLHPFQLRQKGHLLLRFTIDNITRMISILKQFPVMYHETCKPSCFGNGANHMPMEETPDWNCRSVLEWQAVRCKIGALPDVRNHSLEPYNNMDGQHVPRLPLNHPHRIKARDLKLQQRDEERAIRNELCRYRCPCNLCGGRRRPYMSTTVARHLKYRGRHGALRGWTQVSRRPTWL